MFPKIGGKPPKWMVYNGKPYFLMDDLGVFPYFWKLGNTHIAKDHNVSKVAKALKDVAGAC